MMHVLLESAPARGPRRTGWTAASFATHGSLLAAAVIVTMRVTGPPRVPEVIRDVIYHVPAVPVTPAAPSPVVPHPSIPRLPILLPTVPRIPTMQFNPTIVATNDFPTPTIDTPVVGSPVGQPIGTHVAREDEVDRAVVPRAGNPRPAYPHSLRNALVEGDVLARFIVDTLGRVERNSISISQATHGLFADAVREWLPRTRYTPASIAGRPVRQLVEQRIGFTLVR